MCGIVGYYSTEHTISEEQLRNMNNTISHRGPDAQGVYFDRKIGLGHKRLSILDLSTKANQPLTSHNNRYVITYNGEVYNFKEIALELKIELKTTSDTEVVLEAFSKWGVKCVERFNGMFAFAIWDTKEQTLHVFRDRLGIKPLYYFWDNNTFIFSSELKALQSSGFNIEIDKKALHYYLQFGFVPQDRTIYKNVRKMPSGSYGILKDNSWSICPYWKIDNKITANPISNLRKAKQELTDLLFSSIEYRMISDVPLGTFLSGGSDSSLITAIACQAKNTKVNTFSIGFSENSFNESERAKKVAQHLGTDHCEFMVSHNEALNCMEKVMGNFDQPFADSSAIPTYLVSKMAKDQVTVALSGDGGDELFMGYGIYNWAKRLSNPIIWRNRKAIAQLLKVIGGNRNRRAAAVFECPDKISRMSHIFSQEQYLFSAKELPTLLMANYFDDSRLNKDPQFSTNRELNSMEIQSLFDIQTYLKQDLLLKVDMASMLTSLEVRVPLLDHRIVEFAMNVHHTLKINKGTQKYLLKELLYDFIPRQIVDHPKWGFTIPLEKWFKKELKFMIDLYLSEEIVEKHGVVNYEKVKWLKDQFHKGKNYLYNRMWVLIVLHQWMEKNNNTA